MIGYMVNEKQVNMEGGVTEECKKGKTQHSNTPVLRTFVSIQNY